MARYSDVDLAFTMNQSTHDIFRKTDADSIKTSLRNLILTNHGERKFQPNVGSGVYGMLFENGDAVTGYLLKSRIQNVIQKYEPRVQVSEIIIHSKLDHNSMGVELRYFIRNINQPQTITITLQRNR